MTNKYGYPDVIVNGVKQYIPHDGISVTQLIDSPKIRQLTLEHQHEIEDDIHDQHTIFFGNMAHAYMEIQLVGTPTAREERIVVDTGLGMIHGTPDCYWINTGLVQDWKTVSAWSPVFGKIKKWTEQLNCYAWLLKQKGKEVHKLEIVSIYRDWTPEKAKSSDYPQKWSEVIPIELWSTKDQNDFVVRRLAEHYDCVANQTQCTPEEMWERPSTWAVMKKGNKKATRVLPTHEEAHAWALDNIYQEDKFTVVERPGTRVRCESYCQVSKWCQQFKEYKEYKDVG